MIELSKKAVGQRYQEENAGDTYAIGNRPNAVRHHIS